jgi:hypothetical protein
VAAAAALLLAILGTSACRPASPPPAPDNATAASDDFPLHPGSYWVYRGTVKWQDGIETRETEVSWRMEVVRSQRVGRFTVFVLEGHPEDLAWFVPGKPRGGHIFVKDGGRYYEIRSTENLAMLLSDEAEIQKNLNADGLFLELPLKNGMCLGKDPKQKRRDDMYCWSVGAPSAASLADVKGIPADRHFLEFELAYRSNPDDTLIRFVPGIGIASFAYSHHGSISEADVHLVEYHP